LHRDNAYASLIRWTAPRTGEFYLVVGGFDGEIGSYEIAVDAIGAGAPLEDESLAAIGMVPGAQRVEIAHRMDDALYENEEDASFDDGMPGMIQQIGWIRMCGRTRSEEARAGRRRDARGTSNDI